MANDARNTNTSGKPDSSASNSGSVSGDSSGLRRSSRNFNNCSPGSVRKSPRLEQRVPETGAAGSGKGSPSSKAKNVKEISNGEEIVKENCRDSSPKVGEKRSRRMGARQYKAMFGIKNTGASETKSRKRRLESCFDNVDSGVGDSLEGMSESCRKGVDSGNFKSVEGLKVNGTEDGDGGGNSDNGLRENCDDDVDRGGEEPVEESQECNDGVEMERGCVSNIDGCAEGPYSDVKKNVGIEKPYEVEDGVNGLVGEMNGSVLETLPNQDRQSASSRADDNVNGSRCSEEAIMIDAVVAGGVDTHKNMKIIPSESPTCEMGSLREECVKCSNKSRSNYDSSKQEPCDCISNSMSDLDLITVSKDRGECSNAGDKDSRKANRKDSLVDADEGLCVSCKLDGNLLRCSGKACRRSYHPSCLRTPEESSHISFWYCSECIKKKLALGVHSLSEGIESILDAREVELTNSEGSLKEKQYFVKYKRLAHIHNRWLTETQLLHEAPELLMKLSEQNTYWNPKWAVPQRLLLRRSVIVHNQDTGSALKSHREWLVKWCDLDYDHATWELEDSEFFKKPEVQQLMQEYETRHNRPKSSFISGDNKIQERRKLSHVKHGKVLDSYRAECVNKLQEFYQQSHNAVLLDEQDRMMKTIYFISSILSNVSRPFLIIAPHESLSNWEAEFLRFTTSINVVVYSGKADSRSIIRKLEFYGEGSQLMFQVLLSSVEAISEDLEHIKGIDWEVIVIDDCQEHYILEHSHCIKTLASNWKLLLLNAQLKETIAEYTNILSLLEPTGTYDNSHGDMDASDEDSNLLKERLCSFIISPRFEEYWVPVEMSHVQLEQYCSFMLSNSTVLRLCSKSDPFGSLYEILISMQKCCDHPYIVNPSLRKSLLPEHPSLDAALDMGVKASGKLQLLDKLLSEFRNQGLKVVILFQSIGGSGKDNLELLLDDHLTWRFGRDSFEHVAVGSQPSKKHAALNKFNRESDRSFLLLETRACLPSIKLSSVDSFIILNSDWNPLNDLRALQKIMIDSKLKPIKVFRFYCSYTVEEKALIMAKDDTILDITVPSNLSTKQTLLMWGSSHLFSRLDEFHHDQALDDRDNVALESSLVTDVVQEIVSLVKNDRNIGPIQHISAARLDGRCYLKNTLLYGEQRNQLQEGMPPLTFWTKLLEGRQPQWKYPVSTERNRKRVHYSDDLPLPPDAETDEPVKKRKDSSPRHAGQRPDKKKDGNKKHQGHFDTKLSAQDDKRDLHDQMGSFEMLKPTVLRLCETLMLKDEVRVLAKRFLEYVLNNHQVTREPETILHAFQISVCWAAADVLEEKIDHRKSLDIAIEKMDFKCLEQEVDSVYRKMKLLMKIFLSRSIKSLKSAIDPTSATDDGCFIKEVCSSSQITNKEKDSIRDFEKVKKICEKKIEKLKERQDGELIKFEIYWQEKRAELENNYKVESAFIRYSHAKCTPVVEKLKILEKDYAKKREDLESQICNHRKELQAKQQEESDGEQKKMAQLLELLKPMAHDGQLEKLPSVNSIQLQTAEHMNQFKDSNGSESVTGNLPEEHGSGPADGPVPGSSMQERAAEQQCVSAGELAGDSDQMVTPLVEDGTTCQDEVVEEQVRLLTENCSTSEGEASLLDPANSVPSNLPHQEETIALNAANHSLAVDVVHACGYDQNRSASRQLNNLPNESQMAQNTCAQMQPQTPQSGVARTAEASKDQSVSDASTSRGASTAHASHPISVPALSPAISRVSSSYHSDPLQYEYDRLRMQIGQMMISYEEMKLRLKTERDKEIEELVAQIRRKYDTKLEEAESSFSLKKSELDLNQNMVMMNKLLADTFRSKCMDYKAGPQDGSQKGVTSSSIVLPFQLQLTTKSSSSTSSASVVPNAASPSGTAPPSQSVHPSPTLSPSVANRPPVRSSSGGLQQAMHEIRALAPHLQHTSVPSATSFNRSQSSSVVPLQPSNDNPSSSSPQIPAMPFSREAASSASATELLVQNDANLRHLFNNLPAWPDNLLDHEAWDLFQFGKELDAQQPAGDVVCLSDDD
ncbi:hypothetical protein RND81_11G087600 [Saponaria officinalis]|uniref:Uncharacterized protein n=1 Tax=Saponaria officinalis TaxID=3572 RepID=A0AAW1HLE8_SAPOF